MSSPQEILLPVRDYDLAATLDSGQVFRWQRDGDVWCGVLGKHFLRLTQTPDGIRAEAAAPVTDWTFLREFFQSDLELDAILKTFPADEPMRAAVAACRGLRLLRQDPWECLASFILSSTKQIVQIRQIVGLLCERFGEPICSLSSPKGGEVRSENSPNPDSRFGPTNQTQQPFVVYATKGCSPWKGRLMRREKNISCFTFPTPQRLAACTECELRDCKMGFRAPGLLQAARQIADGSFDLEKIRQMNYADARAELMKLRGVGGKIADCVLLFAYGFDVAFPVDVWVERALQELYFPRRRASRKRLLKFAATHFGPHGGYAQQYLFHYMRTRNSVRRRTSRKP